MDINLDALTPEPETAEDDNSKVGRGRPRAFIDVKRLEALCQVHATDEEIAAHFNVSTKTISRLRKDPEWEKVFRRGSADGKISLRRAQFQQALAGNTGMLVWLGKQLLGQKDRSEITGANNGPVVAITEIRKGLDTLPDDDFARLARENGVPLPPEEDEDDVTELPRAA